MRASSALRAALAAALIPVAPTALAASTSARGYTALAVAGIALLVVLLIVFWRMGWLSNRNGSSGRRRSKHMGGD